MSVIAAAMLAELVDMSALLDDVATDVDASCPTVAPLVALAHVSTRLRAIAESCKLTGHPSQEPA